MIRARKQKRDQDMTAMNLTPLTDVMLALLMLFLLMETYSASGVQVALPGLGPERGPADPTVHMRLAGDGKIAVKIEGSPWKTVDSSQVVGYLAILRKQKLYSRVLISSDPGRAYLDVVKLMDLARSAGYGRISLDSSRERGEGR